MLLTSVVIAPNNEAPKTLTGDPGQQGHTEQNPIKGFAQETFSDPVSFFTLALVGCTVLLWRATLRLAREARQSALEQSEKMERSVIAATDAARAAADQVKIAQETAYRDLRAYLSVQEVRVKTVRKGSIDGELVLRNAGQTPAEIKVFFNTTVDKFPLTDARDAGPETIRHSQHKPFINRGSDEVIYWWYPVGSKNVNVEAVSKLLGDGIGHCFYLYGRVEFMDYLRRERVLHFAFRSAGDVEIGKPFELIPMPKGNEYEDRSKGAQAEQD